MANELINVNYNDNIMDYLVPKLIVLNLEKRIFLLNILEEDNRAKKNILELN